ncbi:MAG TPA: DUF503 family protein [Polyangiaceae bacterium]|nr:DUF503 family protein [Polyangiaceae bacterium]
MFVGVARLVLSIPGARSLKDRRRVVKGFKDRVRARLGVSLAEVGELERYQVATVGVAVVANEAARCSEMLSAAVAMARVTRDAVLADVATEIITLGEGGRSIQGGIESALDEPPDTEEENEPDTERDES